jgi:hypothetical protein
MGFNETSNNIETDKKQICNFKHEEKQKLVTKWKNKINSRCSEDI